MPVIPVRERRIGPGGIETPRRGVTAGEAVGRGLQQISEPIKRLAPILEQHADRLQRQHDIATTQSAANAFSDESRNELQGHLSLQGSEAKGSLAKYQEWYDKKVGEVDSKLQNKAQQESFNVFASNKRSTDLNNLSRHQAREHQRHLESLIPSTISSVNSDVTLAPFDEEGLNNGLEQIKIAYENARPGLDNSAEIAREEVRIKLNALSGMTQIDPLAAKKRLEKWKDDLGTSYVKAKDIIDTDVIYLEARSKFPFDYKKQREYAKTAEGVSEGVRKSVRNRINNDDIDAKREEAEAITQTEEGWYKLLINEELTEAVIKNSGVPNSRKALWLSKLGTQKKGANQADKDATRVTYSDWLERVDLTPNGEGVTEANIYAATDPNNGGLTGPQASTLVDRLRKNRGDKKAVKESVKSAKNKIKRMYIDGGFGPITGKPRTKEKSKAIKTDVSLELEEWISDNPDKDPNEWLDSKLELVAAEQAAEALGTLWESFVPGRQEDQRLQDIASGEQDLEIAKRYVKSLDYDMTQITDDQLEQIINTTEFNKFKTELLKQ